MRCRRCGAKWNNGNIRSTTTICPICDIDFNNDNSALIFDSAEELVQKLIEEGGAEILLTPSRINSFLNDYFPMDIHKRMTIKTLLDNGINEKIMLCLGKKMSAQSVISEAVAVLSNDQQQEGINFISFLCGVTIIDGDDLSSSNFYLSQLSTLLHDRYRIMALEKALAIKEDAKIILLLADLKSNEAEANEKECLIKRAAELGDINAMYLVAHNMLKNDKYKALDILKNAAEKGNSQASYEVYQICYGEPNLQSTAVEYLKRAVNCNYIPAMYDYGIHLLYGDNVEQNLHYSEKLLQQCATQGWLDAISKLIYLYSVGHIFEKNENKVKYYKSLRKQIEQKLY